MSARSSGIKDDRTWLDDGMCPQWTGAAKAIALRSCNRRTSLYCAHKHPRKRISAALRSQQKRVRRNDSCNVVQFVDEKPAPCCTAPERASSLWYEIVLMFRLNSRLF